MEEKEGRFDDYLKAAGPEKFTDKMGHNELYNLLLSREMSWQQIILDLIRSEQIDPWDIDLALLTRRYIEKIHELDEANFFISSKILLAAAILLRIKSEILVDKYIKSLDEILFGKPEKKEKIPIEIDLDDVAELFPRTPLPRPKKVTLPELMHALSNAMMTEQRRIRKEITVRHAARRLETFLPKKRIDIREKIKEVYGKITGFFSKSSEPSMRFTQLAETKEEKIPSFYSILYLDFQKSIFLEQPRHFEEIFIYLTKTGASPEDIVKELEKKEREYARQKMKDMIEQEMKESAENEISENLPEERREIIDDTIRELEDTEEFKAKHPEKAMNAEQRENPVVNEYSKELDEPHVNGVDDSTLTSQ